MILMREYSGGIYYIYGDVCIVDDTLLLMRIMDRKQVRGSRYYTS